MIKVSVDEAHAFDMLSILEVKGEDSRELWEEIADQISRNQTETIYHSPEYKRLLLANGVLFELIDQIKTDEGDDIRAVLIDKLNYKRFVAKQALQERFFGLNSMTETKNYEHDLQ